MFKLTESDASVLAALESESLEFKQTFSFDAKIMKTCASFANNRGGYIIFGVKDGTRALAGLSAKHTNIVGQYDLAVAQRQLNDAFAPRIEIDLRLFEFQGKSFGVLYVYECAQKPVVATKNKGDIKDRDIYFRYSASTEKIKHAELDMIIKARIQEQLSLFLSQVQIIAKQGPENTEILNLLSGEGSGVTARQFAIEKESLDALKVVKVGEFTEEDGSPALRLVADVKTIREHHNINKDTVVHVFLDQEVVGNPATFLAAICSHDVKYAPVYFFARLAGYDITRLRKVISEAPEARNYTVSQLLDRLDHESKSHESLQAAPNNSSVILSLRSKLLNQESVDVNISNLLHTMSAIRSLEAKEIQAEYVFGITRRFYELARSSQSPYLTDVRKTICYLDRVLNPPNANDSG